MADPSGEDGTPSHFGCICKCTPGGNLKRIVARLSGLALGLGHASITTTLDRYGHLYPGEMDRYADRLDDAAGIADAAR